MTHTIPGHPEALPGTNTATYLDEKNLDLDGTDMTPMTAMAKTAILAAATTAPHPR